MALALPDGGRLVSLERDERAAGVARRHLDMANMGGRVDLLLGDAMDSLEALPADTPPFELIFLDADKKRSGQYVETLLSRGLLAPHGLLLIDNVLWKGEVLARLDPSCLTADSQEAKTSMDVATRRSMGLRDALHDFSMELAADARVHQLLLPLRDGLTLAQHAHAPLGAPLDAAPLTPSTTTTPLASYLRLVGSEEPTPLRPLREAGDAPIGVQHGRLLHMLVRVSRASRVLEVGGGAYVALWMALALPDGGRLVSLERDERAADVARRHLDAAGMGSRVDLMLGDSTELPAARADDEPPFELIFWRHDGSSDDAPSTASSLQRAASMLAPHGLLVLLHASPPSESAVEALAGAAHAADSRWRVVTLPTPDGEGGVVSLIGLSPEDAGV